MVVGVFIHSLTIHEYTTILLLLLSSSSSSSHLQHIYVRYIQLYTWNTLFLRYIVLLFSCSFNLWYIQWYFPCWVFRIWTSVLSEITYTLSKMTAVSSFRAFPLCSTGILLKIFGWFQLRPITAGIAFVFSLHMCCNSVTVTTMNILSFCLDHISVSRNCSVY